MQTNIQIPFADGTYDFCIDNDGALAIEQRCKAEISVVRKRLLNGVYMDPDTRTRIYAALEASYGIMDIWEPIRQGLFGGTGGMVEDKPTGKLVFGQVDALMKRFVSQMPWDDRWKISAMIMETCAAGAPVIEKKKESPVVSPRAKRRRKTATPSA